jgi:hypothetical protein
MEMSMEFPQKNKVHIPYDPTIPLLGIYPKVCKSIYKTDTCILTFIAAMFIKGKLWNQPRCPIINEWIKKIWWVGVCVS